MRSCLSRSFCWLLSMGMALAASLAPAAESPPGESTAVKPAPFELTIGPDTQALEGGFFLFKLKKTEARMLAKSIGEIIVWWTSPSGHRTSFPMKQVSDDIWANRITLESPAGRGSISVMVLGKSENGTLGKTIELDYDFDMPGLILAFRQRRDLGEESTAELKTAETASPVPESKKKIAWSVPVIAILVMVANVLLLIPVLIVIKMVRGMSPARERRNAVLSSGVPALHPVFGKLLAGAGMIDRKGDPLEWDEGSPNDKIEAEPEEEIRIEEAAATQRVEAQEPVMDLQRVYTAEEIQAMSTENIVSLIDDTLEHMEFNEVTDELKKLVRIAEKELARRDQEREANEKATALETLVSSGAEIDDNGKFDLKNLSF